MAFHGTFSALTGTVSVSETLYTVGHAYVSGALQVGANVIRASDGGDTITMDTSDNVTLAGVLKVPGDIIHVGDTDTKISFTTDLIDFAAGNITFLTLDQAAQSEAVINEGSSDVDFRVESKADAHAFFLDAGKQLIGLGLNDPDSRLDETSR